MSRRFTKRGFTLVEAVAAMVVLSIALPAAIVSLSDSSRVRVDDANRVRAAWLAEAILETCVADAAGNGAPSDFNAMADSNAYAAHLARRVQPTFGAFYGNLGLTWSVNIVPAIVERTGDRDHPPQSARVVAAPGLHNPAYRLITVEVQWRTANGEQRAFELEAVVARP